MGSSNRGKVLIVDDTPEIRLLLATVLRLDDYEVVGEAADGFEGIEMAERTTPDIVILDGRMPRCSGTQALPDLRRVAPRARIVFFSAEPPAVLAGEALAAGADAYVDKVEGIAGIQSALARLAEAEAVAA